MEDAQRSAGLSDEVGDSVEVGARHSSMLVDKSSETVTDPRTPLVDGDRRVDRRRNGASGGSPMDTLARLPAVVMLDRIPIPTLAVVRDGIILFANAAFAEMLGYQQDRLAGLALHQISLTMPHAVCVPPGIHAPTNPLVKLRHREGWTVRAKMSKSALMRRDDAVALVMFENLTERLWMDELDCG